MRANLAVAGACCAALLPTTPALAAWSSPQSFPAPYASGPVVAVDGHRHAVVAWPSRRRVAGIYRASVNVAARTADGRVRTRVVWSRTRAEVTGLDVGIDPTGEIVVVWADWDRTKNVPSAVVRSAFGTLSGRFGRARVVGKADSGGPSLAIASDGRAFTAWDGRFGSRGVQRTAGSWRRPHHAFGTARMLTSSTRLAYAGNPQTAFDAGGTAYVWSRCAAIVLRARPATRSFTLSTLALRALSFGVSLAGPGRGLATWVDGTCSSGAETARVPGPVLARVLTGGTFALATALTAQDVQATETTPVALPGGRGSVSWSAFGVGSITTKVFGADLASNGTFSAPHELVGDAYVAVAADGRGDGLLRTVGTDATPPRYVVRPVGGGADAVAPAVAREIASATATPSGRGAALAWPTTFHNDLYAPNQRLKLSVWRP